MLSLPSALPPQASQPDESARAQQLQARLTAGARTSHGTPQDVQSAATELAGLFVTQMLQAMRRTVPKSGLFEESFAHDTYTSLFDQEIARHIAQREDLGLTALLQRQLTVLNAYRQQATPTHSRFIMPVEGQHSSPFGWRTHPIDHEERWHGGIDIAAPSGTPVRAAAAGQVVFSGTQPGYGNVIIIEHTQGYSTLYAHNAENLVPVGTAVRQGQPIAAVGSTGRSTGPHVHFEVRRDGQQINPAPFFETGGSLYNKAQQCISLKRPEKE
jgi:murein DD-endopeptidase MepM/ murein hydrolase activator NlpD